MASPKPAPSKKKAPLAKVELLAPEKPGSAKSATVALLPTAPSLGTEKAFVDGIREDLQTSERFAQAAVYVAMRIGIRLVFFRDNNEHGALDPFLKKHFANSRRTLFNYIRIADEFLAESKLTDKRTHKLTNASSVAPILEEQLDLFAAPKGKGKLLQPSAKKLVAWVGTRGLTQIYKDIAASHDAPMPPSRKGKAAADKRSTREIDEDDLRNAFQTFREEWITDGAWKGFNDEELAEMETFLSEASKETTKILKLRK